MMLNVPAYYQEQLMLSAAETPMSAFPQGMPYDNLADQEPVRDRQGGCLCRIVTEFVLLPMINSDALI